jgi:hypothetical protein
MSQPSDGTPALLPLQKRSEPGAAQSDRPNGISGLKLAQDYTRAAKPTHCVALRHDGQARAMIPPYTGLRHHRVSMCGINKFPRDGAAACQMGSSSRGSDSAHRYSPNFPAPQTWHRHLWCCVVTKWHYFKMPFPTNGTLSNEPTQRLARSPASLLPRRGHTKGRLGACAQQHHGASCTSQDQHCGLNTSSLQAVCISPPDIPYSSLSNTHTVIPMHRCHRPSLWQQVHPSSTYTCAHP